MPDFLYLLRPTRVEMLTEDPTDDEIDVVARHFAYLKGLHEAGTVVFAGRTREDNDSTFGICVFRADREEEARQIMNADPAVVDGVMTAELRPFSVALGG